MKKMLILLLMFVVIFTGFGNSVSASSKRCSNIKCSTTLMGTSYNENVLTKENKKDSKVTMKGISYHNGELVLDAKLVSDKHKVDFELSGEVYYDKANNMFFIDFNSLDSRIIVVSSYIRLDVDGRLLNKSNKDLIEPDVLYFAIEVDGDVYYFENEVTGLFQFVIDSNDHFDFKSAVMRDESLVPLFGAMMKWFMNYDRMDQATEIDEDSLKESSNVKTAVYVIDDGGAGGGSSAKPNRDQYVPDYLYDKYYIFKYATEGMYYNGDYMFYKVTYPNYMGNADALITYTIEMELVNIMPGDTRHEWSGQVGLQINVLQQRHYAYYKTDDEIVTLMNYESFRLKNTKMKFTVKEDDLAWRSSVFFGNADKGIFDSNDIKVAIGFVPVVDSYASAIWDVASKDLASNMSNSYTKTYDSYLSTQINKDKIAVEIKGEANKYWLQEPGHYLQLSGFLTLKEFNSVTGYKDTSLNYSFDVYTYNGWGFWTDKLYSNNRTKNIVYYR